MGEAMQALPHDDPLMLAWENWKITPEFSNAKDWIIRGRDHIDGSVWRAFMEGWAAHRRATVMPLSSAEPLADVELEALRQLHAAYYVSQWTSYVNRDGSTTVKADKDAAKYLHAIIQCAPRMIVELSAARSALSGIADPAAAVQAAREAMAEVEFWSDRSELVPADTLAKVRAALRLLGEET